MLSNHGVKPFVDGIQLIFRMVIFWSLVEVGQISDDSYFIILSLQASEQMLPYLLEIPTTEVYLIP